MLDRLERFYDAVPRDGARVEDFGELVLFVPDGSSWPFYGRPRLGGDSPTVAEFSAVRTRQRELGLPETFEWVDENTPGLIEIAEADGLSVLRAPLMVLDPASLPDLVTGARILDADSPTIAADLSMRHAVAAVGFSAPGTETGSAGLAERDAAVSPLDDNGLAKQLDAIRSGRRAHAIAETPGQGAVASGMYQRVDDIAEIVGVATLPSARRQGLGAAVTAILAGHALDHGVQTVFLSAAEEAVARMYARIGFRRIGTACIAEPK